MALRQFFVFLFAILSCTFTLTAQSSGFLEHTVRDKETPASIAHDFYLNTKDFLLINNFPDDVKLKPGQVVLIRPLEPGEKVTKEKPYKASEQAHNDDPAPAKKTTYTKTEKPKPAVTTENASMSNNDKPAHTTAPASDNLYEKSDGDTHIVQKGQTFYRIAKTYGLTIDQLKKLNNMPDYSIKVGQELKIR